MAWGERRFHKVGSCLTTDETRTSDAWPGPERAVDPDAELTAVKAGEYGSTRWLLRASAGAARSTLSPPA